MDACSSATCPPVRDVFAAAAWISAEYVPHTSTGAPCFTFFSNIIPCQQAPESIQKVR